MQSSLSVEFGYRAQHEAFVINQSGCSVVDVLSVLCFCPIALLLTKCVMQRYYNWIEFQSSAIREKFGLDIMSGADPDRTNIIVVLEFLSFVMPQLLAVTVFVNAGVCWSAALGLLFLAVLILPYNITSSNACASATTSSVSGLKLNDSSPAVSPSFLNSSNNISTDFKELTENYLGVGVEDHDAASPLSKVSASTRKKLLLPTLTYFKSYIMILTCICILAVDFPIFPRNFAKTETVGISLMDVGTGAFLVSSALNGLGKHDGTETGSEGTIPYPSNNFNSNNSDNSNNNSNSNNGSSSSNCSSGNDKMGVSKKIRRHFSSSLAKRLFCLVFGVLRPVVLKCLNYQEHVSEYGVHWNFFVTLFFIWIISDAIKFMVSLVDRIGRFGSGGVGGAVNDECDFRRKYTNATLAISVIGMAVYQNALLNYGYTDYIFSDNRVGLIAANKEGIFSLVGNLSIFFIAQFFSTNYIFNQTSSRLQDSKGSYNINRKLIQILRIPMIVSWMLWYLADKYMQITSRRLCNVAYVSLMLALGSSLLYLIALVEVLFSQSVDDVRLFVNKESGSDSNSSSNSSSGGGGGGGSSSSLSAAIMPTYDFKVCIFSLEYINRSQLIVFLFANILTGTINMSMETILTPNHVSILVLVAYTYLVVVSGWLCAKALDSMK